MNNSSRGLRRAGVLAAAVAGIALLAACGSSGSGSDSSYVYWTANGRTFWRANLDGARHNQRFRTILGRPTGVAVGSAP